MAKTNEPEEKTKVKADHKPATDHEMNRAENSGGRRGMYKGPQQTPGNKRVAVKRRY